MAARSVLISGAGIAGPTLAYWLNRAGMQTTIVERAPKLRDGGYVIDFWGLGYDIAGEMGLQEGLERVGYHVHELRIASDDGRKIAGFGTAVFDELTGGRYVTLGRSDLSRLIFSKVAGESECIFGDEIDALADDGEGVQVRFSKGGERRFDLVIGADGLHSRVRELRFGPQKLFEVDLGYLVAAFETSDYRYRDEDAYVMYCLPGRMIGRFTMRQRKSFFLFVLACEGEAFPGTLASQKALLKDRFAAGGWETGSILTALEASSELYFDRVSQIRMPRWSKGRVALVGDAAFCVSLTAGQGSALAMISAQVLAGELARRADRHDEAFARYESLLRTFILTKQKGAERFAGAFAPRTRFGLWFRNLVVRSFAVPGLARFAVGREMMDRIALPDYHWPD